MANNFKHCLFLTVIFSWQVTNLTSICLDNCTCKLNTTSCQQCSYNITLKENPNIFHQLSVCCENENWVLLPQEYVNKTLMKVIVRYATTCNATAVYLDIPLLNTYSLHIKNSNIKEMKINIKRRNIREIDLSSNKLQYVTEGLFNNFLDLRKLILSRNNIVNILAESFHGLLKLESLDLSENNLTTLTNVFTPLKNLQYLNLSRNNIEFIHENYFNNWLLQHLDVSHNKLRKLAPGALQLLPNLARLLLTDNPDLGITQLDTQLLVGTGRRLQQIDASRTGLYQVPEAFTHSVRFLSLVGNIITSVKCGDFDSYPLLQSLDLSDNKVKFIEDDSLGRLEMLLVLNINKNFITSIPKTLPDKLKYLSIKNNLIKNLTIADFKNLPNLRILMMQNNRIQYIQDHTFDDLLSLEMLDLSNNPIQTLSWRTFDGPLSLRDLRLCYLNISVPAQDGSFPMSSPESVQMLHLQSSPGLARQLLADSAALAAFSHLQYLDLRMNNLSDIRNDLLFYLNQLKTLRLHGNNINCSTDLWLKDWMNWNKSLSSIETCYYSTSDAKTEIAKYNCTFPETFTISDSLPPVNLYSTEMINKLLRYYGFLNNKTDKPSYKHESNKNKYDKLNTNSSIDINKTIDRWREKNTIFYEEFKENNKRYQNKISHENYSNEMAIAKVRESSKILDQNKVQNDQLKIDHKFLDLEPFVSEQNYNKSDNINKIIYLKNKSKSGRRLNTPLNITKKAEIFTKDRQANISSNESMIELENVTVYEIETTHPSYKTEYSPYRSADSNYAKYIGTVVVSSLIVMSLILWISFRLRYKRRRLPVIEREAEDQIEVTNISGGILW